MRFKTIKGIAWLTLPLALGLWLGGSRFFTSRTTIASAERLTRAEVRSFEVRVNTVGVLDAANSHMVSSSIGGDRGKIVFLVEDGARVEKGAILVKLDPTPFEEKAKRLQGEHRSLEAALDANHQVVEWEKTQAEREIRTAEYNLKIAELEANKLIRGEGPIELSQLKSDLEKAKEARERYVAYVADLDRLQKQGFTNQTELHLARKKLDELKELQAAAHQKHALYSEHVFPTLQETAKAKLEKGRMELDQIRNGSVYKIAKAVSALNKARGKLEALKASLEEASRDIENTVIRAPFPGIAVLYEEFRDGQKRKPRLGDQVWQNQPLLYLPDVSSMIVKTQVREVDLHKIELGKTCKVSVDAYPDSTFEGEVAFIGVMASKRVETGMGEKYFQLVIALKGGDSRLRPGMTARITILTDQVRDVLTLPVQAIFNKGSQQYCFRHVGGDANFEERIITCGRQNEDWVEITSGLSQGERVSLVRPPTAAVN